MSAITADGPRRRSQALAVGLLFILLAAGWLCVAHPLIAAYGSQRNDIQRNASLLAEFQRIAAERPELEARRDALGQAEAAQHLTLSAESDGVAAATLQNVVKATIESAGGSLQSTQVKTPRVEGGFRRIGLRVQMVGTVEALRQTLLSLETHQPLIYGEGLELRARQQPRSNGKKVVEDRALEIRLDLYSLAKAPA